MVVLLCTYTDVVLGEFTSLSQRPPSAVGREARGTLCLPFVDLTLVCFGFCSR